MTIDPFSFLTTPRDHQAKELTNSAEAINRALFWDMGTGKTKVGIDTTTHLFRRGLINGVATVAPAGVERNWLSDEVPTHLHPDLKTRLHPHVFKTEAATTKWHQKAVADMLNTGLVPWLFLSYDAWNTERGKQAIWDLMRTRRIMLHLDETGHIKTPAAARTQSIVRGSKHAAYRRIYSGTPVDNSPFDTYSQVRAADPEFWVRELDLPTFATFKSFFGVWDVGTRRTKDGDQTYPILHSYQNLSILRDLLFKIGSRLLIDEVEDLPEKSYTQRYYEMTPTQRRIYEQLDTEYMADFPEDPEALITAELSIVRMLRLQQVLCGYVPADGDDEPRQLIDPRKNPRLDAAHSFVEGAGNNQVVTWTVFRLDADLIMQRLKDLGRTPVRYDGAVSADECERSKQAFKAGDASDLVINQMKGSEGITLTNAHYSLCYTNAYRYLKRRQLEARTRRIGQRFPVLYGDLICPGTRDEAAIAILKRKHETAQDVLGEVKEEWL